MLTCFSKILSAHPLQASNQFFLTDFDIPDASVGLSYLKMVMINQTQMFSQDFKIVHRVARPNYIMRRRRANNAATVRSREAAN